MSWIQTLSKNHLNFENIDPKVFNIDDIAAALSNLCRFTGHLDNFYSVAQHSVYVSNIVPPEYAFEALLHDAAEAYCNDISAPLKALLPDYRAIEARIDAAIRERFGLPAVHSLPVKYADLIMLGIERRDLDLEDGTPWPCLQGIPYADFIVAPLHPRLARVLFLQRYEELQGARYE